MLSVPWYLYPASPPRRSTEHEFVLSKVTKVGAALVNWLGRLRAPRALARDTHQLIPSIRY